MKLIVGFVCTFIILLFELLLVQAMTDLEILRSFETLCKLKQDDSQVEARFAPVIKLNENESQDQQKKWKYKFANKERLYRDNRILLKEVQVKEIYFVTTIRKRNIKSDPTYQWHVIAIPRVKNPKKPYDGLWAESQRCISTLINQDEWLRLVELSSVDNRPAHNLAGETSQRGEVNRKWRKIFGNKIINDLVIESARNRRDFGFTNQSYNYTFYFAPVPSLNQINPDGFRWVSSRRVTRPGIVFGFVLNARGECIKCAKLQIVTKK